MRVKIFEHQLSTLSARTARADRPRGPSARTTGRKTRQKTFQEAYNLDHIWREIVQGTLSGRSGPVWGAQGVPGAVLGVKSWFVGPPLGALMGALFHDFFNAKVACFFVCFLNAFRDEFASILCPKMHSKVSQKWKTCIFEFERLV